MSQRNPGESSKSIEDAEYTFVYGSSLHAAKLDEFRLGLHNRGVDARILGDTRFQKKTGAWIEHGDLARSIKGAQGIVVCIDADLFQIIDSFEFGDGIASAFNLTCGCERILVAVMESRYMTPRNWGWSPLFARFAGLPVVDLSVEVDSRSWSDTLDKVQQWCQGDNGGSCRNVASPEHARQPTHRVLTEAMMDVGFTERSARRTRTLAAEKQKHFRSPWLANARLHNKRRRYDCFLSHNWGPDCKGRDNHARATRIAMFLRNHGLEVFFDDWEMHRYRNIDEAMVRGMEHATITIILLTRKYISKIENGRVSDNCVAEYHLAKMTPGVILVIMEEELRIPCNWGCNAIFAQLSQRLYIDASADDGAMLSMLNCGTRGDNVQRWYAALDALEIRIRTDSAMIEGIHVSQNPAPFIDHRGMVVSISFSFLSASVLEVVCFALNLSDSLDQRSIEIAKTTEWLLWTSGFFLQTFLTFLTCRKPPNFDVHWVEVSWSLIAANLLRSLGALAGFVTQVVTLVHTLDGRHAKQATSGIVGPLISLCLFFGNFFHLLSTAFFQVNSENGIDTHYLLSYRNLPHWTVFGLAASSFASFCLNIRLALATDASVVAEEPSMVALGAVAVGLMLLSAVLHRCWSAGSNAAMRRYFSAGETRKLVHTLEMDGSMAAVVVDDDCAEREMQMNLGTAERGDQMASDETAERLQTI